MLKPAVATDSNIFLGEEASPWHRTQEFKSANCRSGRAVTSRQSATTSGSPCYAHPLGVPDDIGSMTPVTFDAWPSYAERAGPASPSMMFALCRRYPLMMRKAHQPTCVSWRQAI